MITDKPSDKWLVSHGYKTDACCAKCRHLIPGSIHSFCRKHMASCNYTAVRVRDFQFCEKYEERSCNA